MNFHLTIFHIYPFVIGKIQTSFLPNNTKKSRTKLAKQFKKQNWTLKKNGPITSTFGPIINLTNSS